MKAQLLALSIICLTSSAFAAGDVAVDVVLNPMGDFTAKTSDVTGEAVTDGKTVKADKIVVSLKNLKTGMGLRDTHAKDKYLEVNKYPDAIITNAKGEGGKGTGMLKIKGVEKPVTGTYKTDDKMLHAEFPIKLSDFNIKEINYKGVGVEDAVKIKVSVPLKKK